MEIAKIVLAYIQVLLSWPVVSAIVIVFFLKLFKEPLSNLFRRIVRGQVYGVSLEASNPSEQRKEIKEGPTPQSQEAIEKYIKENPKEVIRDYLRVFNGYWFERAYNLIYGTQVNLLEHLTTKGTEGDSYINLFMFYNEFLNRSQFSSTQMADYIGFLVDMKFVELFGEGSNLRVKITPYGVDFLSYIKSQYPTSYKYRVF